MKLSAAVVPRRTATAWSRLTSGILGRGAVSFLLATAGVNVSNFVFHIVISRLLGPSHYGAIGSILSILALLAVPLGAAQLAVTQAVIAHVAKNDSFSLRRLLWRSLLAGGIAEIIFVALIPTLDKFLHLSSPWPLVVTSVWIPLATVGAILQGALIGKYRFRPVAFATFVGGGPVRLLCGAALAWAGWGVTGAIWATVAAQAFSTGSLLFSARATLHSSRNEAAIRTKRRDMALSIASISGFTALIGVDTFLARHFFSANVAGQYAAGAVAAHIAMFIPGAIVTVAFPHWVAGEGTSHASRRAFAQALGFTTALGVLSAGVMTVFSHQLVQVLFGASYANATAIIGPLSFASAAIGVVSLLTYFHLARRSLFALTPWLGVVLAVILIVVHHSSITSVAMIILLVSSSILVLTGIPAVVAHLAAQASDASEGASFLELPPEELDLTLVVPFFNPGSQLGHHVEKIMDVLSSMEISFEVLAVSDGSTDGSEMELAHINATNLSLLVLETNQGKGAALRAGLTRGRGKYLGFIDADGDIPAELLIRMVEIVQSEHPDIVYGSKRHPSSDVVYPPLRRAYSWGYQQLNHLLFRLPIRDTQTGIKVMRRDVLAAVLPQMVEKRFAFDLELFVVARTQGFRNFVEMPVTIGERFSSTVSVRAVRNMLLDTLAIFYRLRVLHYYQRNERAKVEEDLLDRFTNILPRSRVPANSVEQNEKQILGLRILVFNWRDLVHPRAGGAEVYTHSIANEWIRQGHHVTLFCAAVEGRSDDEIEGGLRIIRRGSRHSVYREAKRFYQKEGAGNFDLVIDEVNTRPFGTPRWVNDAPVIALIHQVCRELWFYQLPFPIAFVGRYILEPHWLRRYRNIPTVTLSQSSKESLENYGLRQVSVVPVGFDEWTHALDSAKEDHPTVAFVGRLEAHKRPNEALKAFAELKQEIPTAILWVIGSGLMEDSLRLSGIEGVQFLGKVSPSEKMNRLSRAHVLIATSIREGWGLVVTEAASVGTPTIAYNVPGLKDSVAASNGILCEPSPDHMAYTLRTFFAGQTLNGMEKVSPGGVTSWSKVAEAILEISPSPLASHAKNCGLDPV